MADCCNRFTCQIKSPNQIKHRRLASQFVRHEPSRHNQGVKVFRSHVNNRCVACAWITVFSVVFRRRVWACYDNLCSRFLETQLGVPQLQVLVDFADENQYPLISGSSVLMVCSLKTAYLSKCTDCRQHYLTDALLTDALIKKSRSPRSRPRKIRSLHCRSHPFGYEYSRPSATQKFSHLRSHQFLHCVLPRESHRPLA